MVAAYLFYRYGRVGLIKTKQRTWCSNENEAIYMKCGAIMVHDGSFVISGQSVTLRKASLDPLKGTV